jgi:hypothetical protein
MPSIASIHESSWVVICAAKYLNLQFPTNLINPRSVFPGAAEPSFAQNHFSVSQLSDVDCS